MMFISIKIGMAIFVCRLASTSDMFKDECLINPSIDNDGAKRFFLVVNAFLISFQGLPM
jgi:hypothetical protein